MIDPGPVIDAVVTGLAAALSPLPVGDLRAPAGSPKLYLVVEYPPSPPGDGDLANPEAHLMLRIRLRAVAIDTDPAVARSASTDVRHRAATWLMDRTAPIEGDGWRVSGRSRGESMVDAEGVTVNALAAFELWVVPASSAP